MNQKRCFTDKIEKEKTWKKSHVSIAGSVLEAICIAAAAALLYFLIQSRLFPQIWLLVIGGCLLLALALLGVLLCKAGRKKWCFAVGCIMALLFTCLASMGSIYLNNTIYTLDKVSGNISEVIEIGIYVRADDTNDYSLAAPEYIYGLLSGADQKNAAQTVRQINEEYEAEIRTMDFTYADELVDALFSGKVDAIIVSEAYLDMLTDMEEYSNIMNRLRKVDAKRIETSADIPDEYTSIAEQFRETDSNQSKMDVTTPETQGSPAFVLYISGIDVRGDVSIRSRSDVNILAVVNTKTRQILLLSTPRDYYVPLSISNGKRDKLTHAGIYGIQVSSDTLSMLYDVNVDYYFRVNFTGFVDIIDALGGVTVHSDYAFTSWNGHYPFQVGDNFMDGDKALGFVRERFAFPDGDNQRGKNQMALIQAVLKKTMTVESLKNYSSVLDAIEGSFETNMAYDEIAAIIRNQLSDGGTWNIVSHAVTGTNGREIPYSMSQYAYVMWPDETSVKEAQQLIRLVLEGEVIQKTE